MERARQQVRLPVAAVFGRHDVDQHHRRDRCLVHRRSRRRAGDRPGARHRHQCGRDGERGQRRDHDDRPPPCRSNTTAPAISGTVAARLDADRHAGRMERDRRTATPTSGSVDRRHDVDEHRPRHRHELHTRDRRRARDLRVLVTATNADGTTSAASAATAAVPTSPPVSTAAPTISGTAQRGSALTLNQGTWNGIGNGYAYQWQRSSDGTQLDEHRRRDQRDATRSRSPTRATRSASIVTATNADGTATASSARPRR